MATTLRRKMEPLNYKSRDAVVPKVALRCGIQLTTAYQELSGHQPAIRRVVGIAEALIAAGQQQKLARYLAPLDLVLAATPVPAFSFELLHDICGPDCAETHARSLAQSMRTDEALANYERSLEAEVAHKQQVLRTIRRHRAEARA